MKGSSYMRRIKHLFGRICSLDVYFVVNQSQVTLFYSANGQTGFTGTDDFTEGWLCKDETARSIKKYYRDFAGSHTSYRDYFTWLPLQGIQDGPERVYYFCCKVGSDQNQGAFESVQYWNNLTQVSPLRFEKKQILVSYLRTGPDFQTLGSTTQSEYWDEVLSNETTTTTYTDELQDYDEYANYSDFDQLEMTSTRLPTTLPLEEFKSTTTISLVKVDQEQVLEDLDALLQEESAIPMSSMEGALDKVNSLFEAENVTLTGELLQKLERLGPRVDLQGSQSGMIVRDNLAVIVVDANPEHPVKGLRITIDGHDTFKKDCFDFISGEDYSQYLSTNESDTVVSLPSYITNSNKRMSFVVFRDDRAFQHTPGKRDALVNSRILSVNVENVTEFEGEGMINLYLRPTKSNFGRKLRRACAYWKFLDDGTGYWSEDGCTFIESSSGMLDICQCDHLTHFAEVLITVNKFSKENEMILEILSTIGSCLSILGILLVVVTAFVFESWRKEFSNKIWLQLCLAIFIFNVCFLVKTFSEFDRNIWCMIAGVIMHYSLLVSFFWMLVAAFISYGSLVLVFKRDITRKLLKSSLFAWGIPLLIIVTLLSINHQSYINTFEDTSRNSSFCYPSGLSLWLTVYLPLSIILLINWSLFIAILRSMFASRKIRRHGNSHDALRSAVVSSLLVFLFGLPWIFGLIAYNIIAAYIFTVTASLQGFVLFIFFIVANKRTRDLWVKKLRNEKGRSMPVTMTGTESTSGNAGPSVEMQAFASVKLRESDEIKSLLQKGVFLSKTEYTRPADKPDEYYE